MIHATASLRPLSRDQSLGASIDSIKGTTLCDAHVSWPWVRWNEFLLFKREVVNFRLSWTPFTRTLRWYSGEGTYPRDTSSSPSRRRFAPANETSIALGWCSQFATINLPHAAGKKVGVPGSKHTCTEKWTLL